MILGSQISKMPAGKKSYLGDGLYISHDGYQIWLTAEDGISVLESVALDSNVLSAFLSMVTADEEQ